MHTSDFLVGWVRLLALVLAAPLDILAVWLDQYRPACWTIWLQPQQELLAKLGPLGSR